MSDHTGHSKHYSAADIQRYLKGEMSADEMHAVEKAALDDPFLADAIEGFEMAVKEDGNESLQSGLGTLNKEFAERIRKPARVITFSHSRWWQLSAAAVILVIIGFAVYNNPPGKEEGTAPTLAVAEGTQKDTAQPETPQDERSTSVSPVPNSQITQDKNQDAAAATPKQSDAASSRFSTKNNHRPGNELSKEKASGIENREEETIDGVKNEKSEILAKKTQRSEEPTTQKPVTQPEYNANRKQAPESVAAGNNQLAGQLNNFSGRVVDPANKPLPYASLQVMPDRVNVVTDKSGNFNFTAKDSVVDVQVAVIGFEQRNFRLQNNVALNNLVMEPANQQLEEVVVSGYGSERKKDASTITGKVQNAVPEIGWIEYEKYIDKNKKMPSTNPQLKGEVVVSFHVKRDNTLSDFKIEKSLSKDHDLEAIRLIKDGPAWKLLNSRKTKITVIVKF